MARIAVTGATGVVAAGVRRIVYLSVVEPAPAHPGALAHVH